jgi:hypothetical protein
MYKKDAYRTFRYTYGLPMQQIKACTSYISLIIVIKQRIKHRFHCFSCYSLFLNRPLLPYGVEGFLLVNLIRKSVGLLGRVIGPTQGLYLHTGQHNTEKRRHTSMPRAGFEHAISTFERPKTVLASDRLAIECYYLD